MKRCCDCGDEKSLAEFSKNGTRQDGTPQVDSYCRKCRASRSRERRRIERSTPEGLAKNRADNARWKRTYYYRHHERVLELSRRHYWRLKADPARYARYLEGERLSVALRRERQGLPPRGLHPIRARVWPTDPHYRLPADPFVEWLTRTFPNPYDAARGDDTLVRRVYAYIHGESRHVAITAADAILTANGFNWHDVYAPDEYPWLYEGAA